MARYAGTSTSTSATTLASELCAKEDLSQGRGSRGVGPGAPTASRLAHPGLDENIVLH